MMVKAMIAMTIPPSIIWGNGRLPWNFLDPWKVEVGRGWSWLVVGSLDVGRQWPSPKPSPKKNQFQGVFF